MNLRQSVSTYLRAAGDWAQGTTKPDYGEREPNYLGPLPAVPGRFRVLELLGKGGMGVVYRVFDTELEREVALKSLRHFASSDVYHLKNEFRSRADLGHPNLVELYELHADRRGCFFTMELLRGTDLVSHVHQAAGAPDFERLLECARQLASAICVVHGAGLLHRDIKPSNILVTPSGRAVLLDFGLATQLSRRDVPARNGAGTLEYMAPEQDDVKPLTEATDWYAFGVTLYEAATSALPFRGESATELRAAKRRAFASARELEPAIPENLDTLIGSLLCADPAARPSGREILRRLGGVESASSISYTSELAEARVFTNRSDELARLEHALDEVRAGDVRVIAIHGVPGIGKSELARRFSEAALDAGAALLQTRCHPRESVAFNAIDGLVDDLTRLLSEPGAPDLSELPKERARSLLRLFPTLGRLRAFQDAALDAGAQLYALAFAGLRQILEQLANRAPLVIWIDDAQAADNDSWQLLRHILFTPHSTRILLLLTYRTSSGDGQTTMLAVRESLSGLPAEWFRELELGPLSARESRSLARSLLRPAPDRELEIDWLIDQATGSPFFIRELVHHLRGRGEQTLDLQAEIKLGTVLQQRVSGLDARARALLELAAVAGGRIAQRVLLKAAGLDSSALSTIHALERVSLLRTQRDERGAHAEIYHQLISDQILSLMPELERRARHRALGDAMLMSDEPNLVRVVEQYEAAGEIERVRCYIVSAASRAAGTFAFDLAVQLYRRAIELGGTELAPHELYQRLGDNYADQGRCEEAAQAYERASQAAEQIGLTEHAIGCFRLAAAQYLQAGDESAGLRLLKRALMALELPIPTTRASAIRRLLWYRVLLFARGLEHVQRAEGELPRALLHRLDTLWIVSRSWSMVEHTTSMAFGAQLLIEALDAGEPRRLMQALATEAVALNAGTAKALWRYVDRMHAMIDSFEVAPNDRYLLAGKSACRGIVLYFRGELGTALAHLDEGLAIYRTMPRAAALDISLCQNFRGALLAHLGQLKRLRAELDDTIRDGQLRKDRYLLRITTAGMSSLAFIAHGELDAARAWADAALEPRTEEFSSADYWHLLTYTHLDLYEGRATLAFERVERAFPLLKRNHFLSLSFLGDELRYLRARCAVAYAATSRKTDGSLPRQARAAMRIAEREAKAIAAHGLAPALAWCPVIRANLAALRGELEIARRELSAANAALAGQGMRLYRALGQHALAQLCGESERAELLREAEEVAGAEGVVDLARFTRLVWSL